MTIHAALAALAALLIFGFCFGEEIDRAVILIGLFLFAPAMAGGVPEAMRLSSEKSDSTMNTDRYPAALQWRT